MTMNNVMKYFVKNKILLLVILGLLLILMFVMFSPAMAQALTDIGNGIKDTLTGLFDWIGGLFS